jgi:hypothetical protein
LHYDLSKHNLVTLIVVSPLGVISYLFVPNTNKTPDPSSGMQNMYPLRKKGLTDCVENIPEKKERIKVAVLK